MSQILKSLQLVTQSYTDTPATGTGALYASGSTVYFENAAGTIFPLGYTGNSNGYVIVREYTGSNPGGGTVTYNWPNPPNAKFIQVVCVGGGGGGGSGAYRTTAGITTGGGGGGGGAIAYGFFDKNDLPQSSYTISVGGGGAGGAARTVSSTAGLPGSAGQYTTFGGTIISASGGNGGEGGFLTGTDAAGGYGGFAFNCLPGPAFAIGGITGAQTSTQASRHIPAPPMFGQQEQPTYTTNSPPPTIGGFLMVVGIPPLPSAAGAATTPPTPPYGCAGGGGGAVTSSAGFNAANTGSSGYLWGTLVLNNPVLSGSGTNNLISGSSLFQFTGSIPFTTQYGLGGGGNGGSVSSSAAPPYGLLPGRPGGNGGNYGAGGGGSSYATAAPGSGAGGSGSAGLCIIIEYY